MNLLIFSDTHLTNQFEQTKYNKLSNIIKQVDQVIINGDFWDGYLTNFKSFINSEWKRLFPQLKAKNTIYIYGNHDKKEFMSDQYKLFSEKLVDKYTIKSKLYNINIEHGHRIDPSSEMLYPKLLAHKLPVLIGKFIEYRTYNLIKKNIRKKSHNVIVNYAQKNYQKNNILVCGHSHYQYTNNEQYFNTGSFNYNRAEYMIIKDNKLQLFSERY
jgi:predicted phosphodiesterase